MLYHVEYQYVIFGIAFGAILIDWESTGLLEG